MKRLVLSVFLAVLAINIFNCLSNEINAYQLYKINQMEVERCSVDMALNPDLICD